MRCPYCGSEDTRVSDSRPVEENNSIRRRRVCDACKRRFTTYEKIETIPMVVVKKDNNREPYDRQKIEGGILRACHKRPVSINQIKRVVDEIEKEIFDREEKEISSSEIGELVIKRVHSLDPVAYVRFASVYREFKDVSTFMDELGKLLEQENTKGKKKNCSRQKRYAFEIECIHNKAHSLLYIYNYIFTEHQKRHGRGPCLF